MAVVANWNWEIIIFSIFLLTNLAVGLYHGRKVKTIEDYALGGRNFTTGALVSTIIATWIGGDYLFITLAEVYKTGLHYTIGCLGMVVCLLLNAYVFVPRMQEFLGSISVAESMGKLYGEKIRIISAISGTIASAGFIAVQFKVFGEILHHYVGLSGNYPIFVAASIVVIYSAFGGIRSVAFTDMIQFFTFGVLIPVLGFIVWNETIHIEGFSFAKAINQPLFNYQEFIGFSNPKFWSLALLLLLFSLPDLNPTMFQRVAIGRSIPQVKKAFAISSVILLFILLGMAWIAFLLYSANPNLPPESLVQYMIDKYSPHPGLKSFILIGVVAMCMSTADSNLNSSSVLLTHDLCHPLGVRLKNELVLSKIIAVILGITSIYLALLDYDLLPLVFMTQSFYIPIIDVPLIMAILGFRSTTKSVLIGMSAGLVGVIIWRIFFMDITEVDSILPGMIINFIFFMGSHYLLKQEGGWSKSDTRIITDDGIFSRLIYFVQRASLRNFCKNYAPRPEFTYTAFGLFCLISTLCTMYCMSNYTDANEFLFLYEVMLIIAICFATYPIWPLRIKSEKIIQVAWFIALVGLLVICNTFFVLLSGFAHLQLTIFILNIVVLALLTRWNIALALIGIGVYLGLQSYRHYTNIEELSMMLEDTQLIIYSLLLVATAIIIFLKPQQQNEEMKNLLNKELERSTQEQYKNLIKALQHQVEFVENIDESCIRVFEVINKQAVALNQRLKSAATAQEIQEISEELVTATERLNSGSGYLLEVINNTQSMAKIQISSINYQELIAGVVAEFELNPNINFVFELVAKPLQIECDKALIAKVIRDLINNIIVTNQHESYIKIKAENSFLEYQLSFTKGYVKKVAAVKVSIVGLGQHLPPIKIPSLLNNTFSTAEELTFTDLKRIILAHYGELDIRNSQEGIVYTFTIPINIGTVRPKMMDNPVLKLDSVDNLIKLTNQMNKEKIKQIAKELEQIGLDLDLISLVTKLTKQEIKE